RGVLAVNGEASALGIDDVLRRDADVCLLDDRAVEGIRLAVAELDLLGTDTDGDITGATVERAGGHAHFGTAPQADAVLSAHGPVDEIRHAQEACTLSRRR